MRVGLLIVLVLGFSSDDVWAFPGGAGTCDVEADFSSITGMDDRTRNQNTGDYVLSTDAMSYNPFQPVEITMTAGGDGNQSTFTGIVISVVNEDDEPVGTFDFNDEPGIVPCQGGAMAVTHSITHGNQMARTVFWVPPSELVGDVYVLAYVLSGVRGDSSTQEFYRFVRNDGAVTLVENNDVIFFTGFE